eukprot:TRINITY_DN6222_c0_g1_i1.p1 TRINITY_DN6222_c0_g1~~TRINITY_DN6222_c0_g1_i1.p1  ORF type:complete len:223 (-),score=29.23 TRINITY_DN6222_c0_g1_i1:238-906(-)
MMSGDDETEIIRLRGRECLVNLKRRQRFGLCPSTSDWRPDGHVPRAGVEDASTVTESSSPELVALRAQVIELERSLEAERAQTAEVGERIAAAQLEMGRAVDEHANISASVAEARGRAAELVREEARLRGAMRERTSDDAEAHGRAGGGAGRGAPCPGSVPRGAVVGNESCLGDKDEALSAEKAAEKCLPLYRQQLLRLGAANTELHRRCAALAPCTSASSL